MTISIDLVHHRCQRGRFTRTGRSSDEDQTTWLLAQIFDDRWKPELLKAEDLVRDRTKNSSDRAFLVEQIGTEPGQALQAEREVQFQILFKTMLLCIG